MSDEKPCGEVHPLPCGVDEECAFIEGYTGDTRLREMVENTRETAEEIEKREFVNEDHTNGLVIGLRWVAYELEALIDDE